MSTDSDAGGHRPGGNGEDPLRRPLRAWWRDLSKWNITLRLPILVMGICFVAHGWKGATTEGHKMDRIMAAREALANAGHALAHEQLRPGLDEAVQFEALRARVKALEEFDARAETERKSLQEQTFKVTQSLFIGVGYLVVGLLLLLHGCTGLLSRKRKKLRILTHSGGWRIPLREGLAVIFRYASLRLKYKAIIWTFFACLRVRHPFGTTVTDKDLTTLIKRLEGLVARERAHALPKIESTTAKWQEWYVRFNQMLEEMQGAQFRQALRDLLVTHNLRFQYLTREVYFNPMMLGILITLAGVGVADAGVDASSGPVWSYLLGIGTSLVAWQFTKAYEAARERNHLKILARTFLMSPATQRQAQEAIIQLAYRIAPDNAIPLIEAAQQLSGDLSPEKAAEIRQEVDYWS